MMFDAICLALFAVNCQRFQQEPMGFFGVMVTYQKYNAA